MTDNNEKTFTLAEVREKERAAFVKGRASQVDYALSLTDEAKHYYPDPEPPEPERPTVEYEGAKYGISMDGKHVTSRAFDGAWYPYMKMERLLALASLLPQKPTQIGSVKLLPRGDSNG